MPLHFAALQSIGTVVFIFNMVLFLILTALISTRFYLFPSTFRNSFLHPPESLFVPAAVVSLGFIFINITQYGLGNTGPWLSSVATFLFWLNATNAVVTSSGIYLLMWVRSFVADQLVTNTAQVVYPNFYDRSNDSCLDLSCISFTDPWTTRWGPYCDSRSYSCLANRRRWLHVTRSWISCSLDNILGVHLPVNDPEATSCKC